MNAKFTNRNFIPKSLFVTLAFICLLSMPITDAYAAARIVVVNADAAGEGFNDPTPAQPVGNNFGTTIGQQRLIAFQFAADIWGATLDSVAEIRINANFDPLTCTANSGVLGSAGAARSFRNFPGTEYGDTSYHSALADKRAGRDLSPGNADINATFNSSLGTTNCLTNSSWYYGLDTNQSPNQTNLVVVALHEFAHGLGFSSFVNSSNGVGARDIFSHYTFDTTTGKLWIDMTNAERQASASNTRRLIWNGRNVTAALPGVLRLGTPLLTINAPSSVAKTYAVGTAQFGAQLATPGVTANIVAATDGDATPTDVCAPITNPVEINGNIALIDRGNCNFTVKVKNAQNAGAVGVIIVDNVAENPPPGLGGDDATISIPAVRIALVDGNTIKGSLGGNLVNGTLGVDPNIYAGADSQARAFLFTPDPVQSGSSVSHWDTSALPNQLMEPSINGDLTHQLTPPNDLTLPFMRDIGWFIDANGDSLPDGEDVLNQQFKITAKRLTRDAATGEYITFVTITNTGTSVANNVQLTTARLGTTSAVTLPQSYGKLAPGATATRLIRFPASAATGGTRTALRFAGTHTTTPIGGTFGNTPNRDFRGAPR